MSEITIQKNNDFIDIYNKSYRLAAAVFVISNVIDQNEELRTKTKKLSLDLVSMSVNLKDISFPDTKRLVTDIEKKSFELMSMLDIASVSGLISKMNGNILKEEFQSFILELNRFSEKFENNKNASVGSIFKESLIQNNINNLEKTNLLNLANEQKAISNNGLKNGNGHKRKDLRKNTILDFIKGQNDVSIKDIVPNIIGCSEKTIQRELIQLINDGKIRKIGERRWSKYSLA
ncbi:MAG: hypothetical protein AAB672_01725 [Patescibacteria group bacterium]